MNDETGTNTEPLATTCEKAVNTGKGIEITALALLPKDAILDEARLAEILRVTTRTVRRMVSRFELPPPVRFAGRARWIVGRILAHIDAAAERAARRAEKQERSIQSYFP